MESSRFLEVLFEGQEEVEPSISFSASETKLSFPLPDHAYGCAAEKTYEAWAPDGISTPKEADADDFFQLLINPNEVYNSRSPLASPGSDSGISDDPRAETPTANDSELPDPSSTVIYEVVCDMGVAKEAPLVDCAFPGPLAENWMPLALLPEACGADGVSVGLLEDMTGPSIAEIPAAQPHLPSISLTDEERRLLRQEGVFLQNDLPLTKAEERILKKVRRKIRNKQSAQDSRRRKKEYIDGLESRVAACSTQNQELRKKVLDLETHNVSLLEQLQKLQGFLKQRSTKAAQTSTCLLILIFSLGLFILPNCSSWFGGSQLRREGYRPSGVISRNILNQGGLPEPEETISIPDEPGWLRVQMERPREDSGAGGARHGDDGNPRNMGGEVFRNRSDPESLRNARKPPEESLAAKEAKPGTERDALKQIHADEM